MGYDSGNTSVTSGRTLPWLQDDSEYEVWTTWDIDFRDVAILDGENRLIAIYNLTTNGLSDSANYDELDAIFREVASGL